MHTECFILCCFLYLSLSLHLRCWLLFFFFFSSLPYSYSRLLMKASHGNFCVFSGVLQIKIFNNLLCMPPFKQHTAFALSLSRLSQNTKVNCFLLKERKAETNIFRFMCWRIRAKDFKSCFFCIRCRFDIPTSWWLNIVVCVCLIRVWECLCRECLGRQFDFLTLTFRSLFHSRSLCKFKGENFLNCTNYAMYFVIKENDMIIVQVAFPLYAFENVYVWVCVGMGLQIGVCMCGKCTGGIKSMAS